jgi:hypothetical protein
MLFNLVEAPYHRSPNNALIPSKNLVKHTMNEGIWSYTNMFLWTGDVPKLFVFCLDVIGIYINKNFLKFHFIWWSL